MLPGLVEIGKDGKRNHLCFGSGAVRRGMKGVSRQMGFQSEACQVARLQRTIMVCENRGLRI